MFKYLFLALALVLASCQTDLVDSNPPVDNSMATVGSYYSVELQSGYNNSLIVGSTKVYEWTWKVDQTVDEIPNPDKPGKFIKIHYPNKFILDLCDDVQASIHSAMYSVDGGATWVNIPAADLVWGTPDVVHFAAQTVDGVEVPFVDNTLFKIRVTKKWIPSLTATYATNVTLMKGSNEYSAGIEGPSCVEDISYCWSETTGWAYDNTDYYIGGNGGKDYYFHFTSTGQVVDIKTRDGVKIGELTVTVDGSGYYDYSIDLNDDYYLKDVKAQVFSIDYPTYVNYPSWINDPANVRYGKLSFKWADTYAVFDAVTDPTCTKLTAGFDYLYNYKSFDGNQTTAAGGNILMKVEAYKRTAQ